MIYRFILTFLKFMNLVHFINAIIFRFTLIIKPILNIRLTFNNILVALYLLTKSFA